MHVRTDEGNLTWKVDHWEGTVIITKGQAVSLADVMPDVDRLINERNHAILRAKDGHVHEVLEANSKRTVFGGL
jgi:hypothetical protein